MYDGFISYSHAADDLLAPRLQAGLQRFAKPWWKRRAVRMFRDESSLAANPHLWSSITDALDDSDWFVLLLSEDAASSEWVGKEIEHWVANKDPEKILPVVTGGEFGWSGGDVAGSSVPAALQDVFSEEPRWVDLRFAKDEDQLDLKNPQFSAAVADVASAIRGVPKDELASEEVRQHRRTVRTAWAAGIGLVVLAVAAIGFGIRANQQTDLAVAEADRADQNAAQAEANADLARSRELGSAAIEVVDTDPALARILALEAVDVVGNGNDYPSSVVNALWQSLLTDRLVRVMNTCRVGFAALALSPDGSVLAVSSDQGKGISTLTVPDGELLWEQAVSNVGGYGLPHFNPDGTQLATSTYGLEGEIPGPSNVLILDAENGSTIQAIEYPDCRTAEPGGWNPAGDQLTITNGFEPCPREGAPDGWWVEVVDGITWESERVLEAPDAVIPRFDDSGRMFLFSVFSSPSIHEPPDYQESGVVEEAIGFGDVSPNGSVIATSNLSEIETKLFDSATGRQTDVLGPMVSKASTPAGIRFTPDGTQVAIATDGAEALVVEVRSGRVAFRLPSGPGDGIAVGPGGRWLYTSHPDGTVKVWDLGAKTINSAVAGDLSAPFVNGNSFEIGSGLGAFQALDFENECPPFDICSFIHVFDTITGGLMGGTFEAIDYQPLPDGRLLYKYPEEWSVWDPSTDETTYVFGCVLVGEVCEDTGEPADLASFTVSQDGSELLMAVEASDGTESSSIVDPTDWSTIEKLPVFLQQEWVTFSDQWFFGFDGESTFAVDRSTGDEIYRFEFSVEVRNLELSASRRSFAAKLQTDQVVVVSLGTWETEVYKIGPGKVRGMAFDPEDRRLALSDEDEIHILDLDSGLVTLTVPIPGVSDLHWLDSETFVVGTNDGQWFTLSLNVEDLIEAARNPAVPREFTANECSIYNIDPCPTLGEIAGG